MIKSKKDYNYYLECDRIALSRKKVKKLSLSWIKGLLMVDYVWKFQKALRKMEYLSNKNRSVLDEFVFYYIKYKFHNLSIKLGFSIPPNVFGPGLSISHPGTIVVNSGSKVGRNCRLHVCVNIGTEAGFDNKAPRIGDNVYFGPGVKIFGNIEIGSNIAIGANAVVTKSFMENSIIIAGVPAKKLANIDINSILIDATRIVDMGLNGNNFHGIPANDLNKMLFHENKIE